MIILIPNLIAKRKVINDLCRHICLIGCTKSDEEPSFGMQKLTFNTKIGNQMQNLYCRNVRNVKFPKIVAEKFAFYSVLIIPVHSA